MINFPLELLTETFKYIEYDNYKTLYSCILVNKQWHNINISTLWRNPFVSEDSIKIIINCFLEEDKNFLTRNHIKLTFELLEKPPLHNYARFGTRLFNCYDFQKLIKIDIVKILRNKLEEFILDHSAGIREFSTTNYIDYNLLIYHHRFDNIFQNLYELDCCCLYNSEIFDKLLKVCKNIQSLKIYYNSNDKYIYKLAQLIKAQKHIKYLVIESANKRILPDELKKAILTHSQSITFYESDGIGNKLDNLLIPTLKNLKTLVLTANYKPKNLKNITLPSIKSVRVYTSYQPFLSDLSDFININGKTLKNLDVSNDNYDDTANSEIMRKLFQSIAQSCENLENLSTIYDDELDQELMEVLNSCTKLKSITFDNASEFDGFDGDKILTVLNQTLPKKLGSMICTCEVFNINDYSLDILMKNWSGPKPLTMKIHSSDDEDGGALRKILKKYQDLGFLN